MTRRRLHLAILLLVAPLIVGCTEDPASNDGDCNARISWDGIVYEPHSELRPVGQREQRLGSGDVLDCDGSSVGTVEVFAVDRVDSTLAISVTGEWRGTYVNEDAPKSSWPPVLKIR
jgi:hypothetical protein